MFCTGFRPNVAFRREKKRTHFVAPLTPLRYKSSVQFTCAILLRCNVGIVGENLYLRIREHTREQFREGLYADIARKCQSSGEGIAAVGLTAVKVGCDFAEQVTLIGEKLCVKSAAALEGVLFKCALAKAVNRVNGRFVEPTKCIGEALNGFCLFNACKQRGEQSVVIVGRRATENGIRIFQTLTDSPAQFRSRGLGVSGYEDLPRRQIVLND